jgi:NitT/TauT family transport system substrate-binding protein
MEQLKETLVTGDKTFMDNLDIDFALKDLVNYDYVTNAMNKYDVWDKVPGVNPADPTHRKEVFEL